MRRKVSQRLSRLLRAEAALRTSEERLRLARRGAHLGSWHWNVRTGEVVWSELAYTMFGVPQGTPMTFDRFMECVHPDDRAPTGAIVQRALEEHSDLDAELRAVWPDGSVHWLSSRGSASYDANGEPVSMEGMAQDITARKKAAQQIHESEARFRHLAEVMPHLVWQVSPKGSLLYVNDRARSYLGMEPSADHWIEFVHPDDRERTLGNFGALVQRGEGELMTEARFRRHDGVYRWFVSRAVAVHDAAGKFVHVVGTSTDIEDLKVSEAALRESKQRLEVAIRGSNIGFWDCNLQNGEVYYSPEWKSQLGYADHEIPDCQEEWRSRVHPDDLARVENKAYGHVARPGGSYADEYRLRHRDGSYRNILSYGTVTVDTQGKAVRLLGCHVDLTQIKRLEEELRQAQKMEAVGRLAGGVAHDFNNLLTVILGHASLIQTHRDLPRDVPEAVRGIALAAERAASLTAQLLAFGRRQVMQSQVLDLGVLVAEVIEMLRRVLGEDVLLRYEPARGPTPVHVDPGMLTQVLLNLAVNARDAMPQGGLLVVRTSIEPLDPRLVLPEPDARGWACLSVADTGTGIAPSLLPSIFEPFVTSKDVGKGTGLGLSTVYGIVRQHHGYVTVDSDVGKGSTFKVFLPLTLKQAVEGVPRPSAERPRGHGELILLVEDDNLVCTVLNDILLHHGYRVALARTGKEALRTWSEHGDEVDLVLTDAVMPGGLTGIEVLSNLRARKPALKAILSSGYSPELVGEDGADPCVSFLQKPFSADQLLSRIRCVLDQA